MIPLFEADTADELWPQLLTRFENTRANLMENNQETTAGRGGRTIELLHAVLHLRHPKQRWMSAREPALNPAFALAEVIWILAGRQDAAFLNHWNPGLPKYAGSGTIYHGAYGWRLREEHGLDQLQRVYQSLCNDRGSRQAVLQIWKPSLDLPDPQGKPVAPDIPCNVSAMLKVRDDQLHWTQIMRSNDVFRGLPYNLVQWTSLQEVFAGWLGVEVGSYTHFGNSLHIYEKDWPQIDQSIEAQKIKRHLPANTDDLALSHAEFLSVFPQVEQKASEMTMPDLSSKRLETLVGFEGCPQAYQNMLCVLAADTARRRGWITQAQNFIEKCSNPVFQLLWDRWDERKSPSARPI